MPTETQIRILNALRRAAEAYDADAEDTERERDDPTSRVEASPQHLTHVVTALHREALAVRQLTKQLTQEYDAADVPTLDDQLTDLVGAWKLATGQET